MTTSPVNPKSSENDPPAANQPLHDEEASDASPSDNAPGASAAPDPAPAIVPGKPDGEVDTRP